MNLAELGEDQLLARLLPHLRASKSVVLGPGDDCAIVLAPPSDRLLVLKTDCVVEGVHFDEKATPSRVGWKAMARPLSDFAAMSALPQFALVTLIARADLDAKWIQQLYRGLTKCAEQFGVSIVGGETSSSRGPLAISLSVTGEVERDRWVSRRGGRVGDELFVTGKLGGSLRRKHLDFTPRLAEARWLTEHFKINAMMDLSDGLGADLPRLARASGVGFEIEEATLPRTPGCTVEGAITDGEDYELLLAISASEASELVKSWKKKFPKLPLTRIGRLLPRTKTPKKMPRGYAHFH